MSSLVTAVLEITECFNGHYNWVDYDGSAQ